ncbi:hypothetical protein BDW22DRAFT_265817 [Trametopsis cervina]|nr:hypothetical protein BDW22DRAFT_265817 [Trametopsis cervina]
MKNILTSPSSWSAPTSCPLHPPARSTSTVHAQTGSCSGARTSRTWECCWCVESCAMDMEGCVSEFASASVCRVPAVRLPYSTQHSSPPAALVHLPSQLRLQCSSLLTLRIRILYSAGAGASGGCGDSGDQAARGCIGADEVRGDGRPLSRSSSSPRTQPGGS